MINYFRKEMSRPIVGIGHSAGGVELYDGQGPLNRPILIRLSKCSAITHASSTAIKSRPHRPNHSTQIPYTN
jgi:hypothetical protein